MKWPVHSVCFGLAFAGCINAAESDPDLSKAPDFLINVEEPVLVHDTVAITASLLLSLDEKISVSESVFPAPRLLVSVVEPIMVSDVSIPAPSMWLQVQEVISVNDTETIDPYLWLKFEENITANDVVLPRPAFMLSVFEQIQVNDLEGINLPLRLNVLESIAVNDQVMLTPGMKLLISENILVHDNNQQSMQAAPQILATRSIAGLSNSEITPSLSVQGAVTELEIAFSEPMRFSADNNVDVANIANYRLLSSSINSTIFPSDCSDALPPAVAAIDVQMHGYIESFQTVVLRSKLPTGFPSAFYQLIACSAGIQSELGTELDGDADLLPGGDYAIAFSVSADNLLQNPNFSNGSNHWLLSGSTSVSQADADLAIIAGSILLDASATSAQVSQCVDLAGTFSIAGGLKLGASLYAGNQPGLAELGIEYFSQIACSGISLQQSSKQLATQIDSWIDARLISKAPSAALSARVSVTNPQGSPALLFDRSYLVPFTDLIFSSGFEDHNGAKGGQR